MDELSQLKAILKNSFAGIKSDMDEIKSKQSESISASFRVKEDVDRIREDYAPKEKINALKIKIGEINDNLRKIWDLDASIKAVDEKKIDKKDFESRFEKLKDEIARKLSEINSSTNKKVVEYTNSLTRNIEDVNNNTAKVFSRITEQMKVVATKGQMKELAANVTQELVSMKREVAEIKKIKDTITASELEKRTGLLNARVDLLAKEILKTNQSTAQNVTSEQVKSIVESINHEFDVMKTELSDLVKLRRYIGLVESESLSKKEFAKQLAGIQSEIDLEKKEIREIRESSRLYARYTDIERNMKGMESLLTRKILDLEKEVMSLKRFERRQESEIVRDERKIEKLERIYEKPSARAEAKAKPDFFREKSPRTQGIGLAVLSVISILLIIAAFAGLAGAIISYFALEPALTNYLTIGAVAAFVLGIVLRVIVVRKRK